MLKLFWPEVDTMEEAKKASHQGAGVCFFVAIVTVAVIILQERKMINLFPIGPEAFIDAALFTIIGIGLLFCSRIAAVAGLLLYLAERVFMIMETGKFNFSGIFFTLLLISGVRGAFAYHRFKKEEAAEAAQPTGTVSLRPQEPAAAEEKPKKKSSPLFKIALGLLFLAAVIFGGFTLFFYLSGKQSISGMRYPDTAPAQNISQDGMESSGRKASFKLKNGQTVSGEVIYEDDVYLTVKSGSGEQIVIKEDLAAS